MSNYANAIDNYSREQSGISNFASNYKQGVFENRQKDLENWRDNVSKFKGSTIGNGVTLNTEHMKEKYIELSEKIDRQIESEEFDFLKPRKISNSK